MFDGHQELNLSVSSNDQIGKHPREELDHDLVGENQRLREENNTITDGGVAPQCTFARPT